MRAAARIVALAGGVALALFLFRSNPREVVLVYDLAGVPGPSSLEVVISKGSEVVRRATFPKPDPLVRHPVRLTDGSYHLDYRLQSPSGTRTGGRDIEVLEAQTIVLPIGR